jgi:hypothetical protein
LQSDSSEAIVKASPAKKGVQGGSQIKTKGVPAELRKRAEKYQENITKRGLISAEKKVRSREGALLSSGNLAVLI